MAKTDNLTDFLTGVANAIRTKKGTTAKINPQNFETEISSITTSKPEQEKTVEPTSSRQIISPDDGKALSRVIVEAAPLPNPDNKMYHVIDKCLIDIKSKTLIVGCSDSIITPFGKDVVSIGNYSFYYCSGLTSISIPGNIISIGDYAFGVCTALTSVTISNSVTSIGENAFSICISLESVTIPNSVTSIGYGAFESCYSLKSITIPNSVTSIGENAFGSCSGLENINVAVENTKYRSVENCVIEIATNTLIFGCKNSVIPTGGSVTTIGNYAFNGCSGLTSITIPNSVTSIGNLAFSNCVGLTSITIPNSVTSIGSTAFGWCKRLTNITIPDSVTTIGSNAFFDCRKLASVTIGNSVTSIGNYAFAHSRLTSITMLPTTPPTLGSDVFPPNVTTITVPVGCGDAYKTAEKWSTYADKIVEATA